MIDQCLREYRRLSSELAFWYIYICMYTHICVYIYIYICIIHINIYACIYIYMYIHTAGFLKIFTCTLLRCVVVAAKRAHTKWKNLSSELCSLVALYSCMGWLRSVGSLKLYVNLYVSFAKEPYKRDDILQKRPIILRSLLIVATS